MQEIPGEKQWTTSSECNSTGESRRRFVEFSNTIGHRSISGLCLTLLLREFSINTTNLEMISISSCASWLLLWTKKRKNKNNTRRTVTFKQVLEIRIDKHCYNWMVSKICKIITCVWHMTRITLQYFFMVLKSFSITLLPSSSAQRLEALEKAFFLDLHLYVQTSMGMVDETEERMGKPNLISNDMPSGEKALCG